jgi:hypothetical protein
MELLSGKSLKEFDKWFYKKYGDHVIHADLYNADICWSMLPEICKQAFLVEFFDSVGLHMDRDITERTIYIWDYRETEPEEEIKVDCTYLESLNEWWDEGILKCNEIYNNDKDLQG